MFIQKLDGTQDHRAATPGKVLLIAEVEEILAEVFLIGYPFESLVAILMELGDTLGDRQAYEILFETIVQITATREGEITAARMLLTRGAQQMDTEHWYEAIRTLGRALGKLYKHESRAEVVHALYLCARAYENIGLLWAARGTMLAAASIAVNEFWKYNEITLAQALCYNRIKWIELRLGRIPLCATIQ